MIQLYNIDCMAYMATLPDKAFDLAIVDPPYGIGMDGGKRQYNEYDRKEWDNAIPDKTYFDELFRVSKNQIIWGGNYFIEYLKNTRCFIVWDKTLHGNTFADGELAWTSFDKNLRILPLNICFNKGIRFHPTQKPIKLYKWLLKNYAKPGDRILDTHLGNGSSAIAAHDGGFDFVGCEIDKDYFEAAKKRFEIYTLQQKLF